MDQSPCRNRRSIRLAGYDYASGGAYFVTICSYKRECLFGAVGDGRVQLNWYGEIVEQEWSNTLKIRREVELDAFVVMPNHIHGIVWIHDVGAHGGAPGGAPALANPGEGAHACPDHRRRGGAPVGRKPKSLGSFVAGFKSAVTTHINTERHVRGVPVWQRNYYERVIRNDDELNQFRQYIIDNPVRWDDDENHPHRLR